MKHKLDPQNLILGTALGALLVFAIGAATTQNFSQGRFQLVMTDSYLFKIDTATGQVWKSLVSSPSAAFTKANLGE